MSPDLVEIGGVAGCMLAALLVGNSKDRKDHRAALFLLGLTIITATAADRADSEGARTWAIPLLVVAAAVLALAAFFAARVFVRSAQEFWKRL